MSLILASWAALVVSGSGMRAAQPPAPATGTPRMVLQAKSKDLGRVPRGQLVEARFEVANQGDAVLKILEAKPG